MLLIPIYFVAVYFVEKNYFDYALVGERPKEGYRFLVIRKRGLGEQEFIKRLELTSKRLGWQCFSCSCRPSNLEYWLLDKPLEKVIERIKPDFTITLEGEELYTHQCNNYLCLSAGVRKYFKNDPNYTPENFYQFDGFLPSFQDIDFLKSYIEKEKSFYGFLWYPTCQKTDYIQVTPKKIFYSGNNWDNKRKGEEFTKFFSLLDKKDYLNVYGPKNKWQHTPNSAKGLLPFDGVTLLQKMQECGVTLVLHAQAHLDEGAASARIFEAAAASTVIISDKHPLVVGDFQDSVLYIDADKSGEEIFKQVEAHMQWILENPQEALDKAKKAHEIFVNQFTLEDQLLKLATMHSAITRIKS